MLQTQCRSLDGIKEAREDSRSGRTVRFQMGRRGEQKTRQVAEAGVQEESCLHGWGKGKRREVHGARAQGLRTAI